MKRILVVEDDPDLRLLMEAILGLENLQVTAFERAEAAVDVLGDFDLLLLDIRLPGMSGLDLLRLHVESGGQAPAVVMSAHAGIDVRQEALAAGAVAMLTKPFNSDDLLAVIRDQLSEDRS